MPIARTTRMFSCMVLISLLFGDTCFSQSNWEWRNPLPQGNAIYELAYGNGQFVGVGDGTIITSPDGKNWTSIIPEHARYLLSVAFGVDRFVAVGDSGKILSSSDGKKWSLSTSGADCFIRAVDYGKDRFLAVAVTGECFVSSDGITWSKQGPRAPASMSCLAFGNNMFVLTKDGASSDGIYTSGDGLSWTFRTGTRTSATRARYVHDRFYGTGCLG